MIPQPRRGATTKKELFAFLAVLTITFAVFFSLSHNPVDAQLKAPDTTQLQLPGITPPRNIGEINAEPEEPDAPDYPQDNPEEQNGGEQENGPICKGQDCVDLFTRFLRWLFAILLSIAAILALTMIVIAGFQWIAAAGNPATIGDAKDRIMKAVLGLVLAFASWLILNTINPKLVSFEFNLSSGGGSPPPLRQPRFICEEKNGPTDEFRTLEECQAACKKPDGSQGSCKDATDFISQPLYQCSTNQKYYWTPTQCQNNCEEGTCKKTAGEFVYFCPLEDWDDAPSRFFKSDADQCLKECGGTLMCEKLSRKDYMKCMEEGCDKKDDPPNAWTCTINNENDEVKDFVSERHCHIACEKIADIGKNDRFMCCLDSERDQNGKCPGQDF